MSLAGDAGAPGDGTEEHLAELVPLRPETVGGLQPAPGHGTPAYLSSFVGRHREISEVTELLGEARLVTLTGVGGMGKTRLAVEVAEHAAPGRAFFVDLAPVRRPELGLDSLTPAQRDVVALVAEGLTNPEIGERLFISPRTVQAHLSKAYAKLGLTSRRQLRQTLAQGT